MTIKQHIKTICNPFRYLDSWNLEVLARKVDEMESVTKALVLEAIAERKAEQDQSDSLIGRRHADFAQ